MKIKEKLEARRLRKEEGRSIKTIARILGVSSGSVSYWVRDISLTSDQIASLGDCVRQRFPGFAGQLGQ